MGLSLAVALGSTVAEAVGTGVEVEVVLGSGMGLAEGVSAMVGEAEATGGKTANPAVGVGYVPHKFGGPEHPVTNAASAMKTTTGLVTDRPRENYTGGKGIHTEN